MAAVDSINTLVSGGSWCSGIRDNILRNMLSLVPLRISTGGWAEVNFEYAAHISVQGQ